MPTTRKPLMVTKEELAELFRLGRVDSLDAFYYLYAQVLEKDLPSGHVTARWNEAEKDDARTRVETQVAQLRKENGSGG